MIGNKPSIYNAQSVYNQGGKKNGVGWGSVSIGGDDYEYIQLLDKLITVRNLDYLPDGIIIGDGTTTEPKACYFNNNETQAKERGQGLMYNWAALQYLINNNLLPDGWSVLNEDVCNIISHSFNESYNNTSSKESCRKHVPWASNNWNNFGKNTSHLSFIPCGRRVNGVWDAYGSYLRLWTTRNTYNSYNIAIEPYSKWPGFNGEDNSSYCYIRLFKQMDNV